MILKRSNIPLKEFNSFGVEATAKELVEYDSVADLREIFSAGMGEWCSLSGGNNILFTDDYRGTLLHPVKKGIGITGDDGVSVGIRVEAAVEWDDVVAWSVEQGLWGLENLSNIPGYAGAAPVQNIGAYGVELGNFIESVEVFFPGDLSHKTLTKQECGFGYRNSIFKRELRCKAIITAINLTLSRKGAPNLRYGELEKEVWNYGKPTLATIRRAVIEVRRRKLPDPKERGNAGSFFKNPTVPEDKIPRLRQLFPDIPVYPSEKNGWKKLSAAWLIDRADWKGYNAGRVGVYANQALVIVNHGDATGKDILAFARAIQMDVASKFGIKLEMEVNVL